MLDQKIQSHVAGQPEPNFVDVLIVGAGLSGIGTARHLQDKCPDRTFALLESRDTLGGTWDLFRYPGIRSDSDMYTFGYTFKPWLENKSLADGPSILQYMRETASETGIDQHIHYHHRVTSAHWSTEYGCWTVAVSVGEQAEEARWRCRFLMICGGYYDYEQGYTPEFQGQEEYSGTVVHAQHWPEDLDYTDKRAVVIGSGATAVTLVPELAKKTAHTIMLQRSPTYIISVPQGDPWVPALSKLLPDSWVYRIVRWKRVLLQIFFFNLSRKRPKTVKKLLLSQVRKELGEDYDVATHFTPDYNPWDQRMCAVPEGDMFNAVRTGRAEVVTDHIDRFTPTGIRLTSGRELKADIVVLATGLNLKFLGGVELSVDGEPVHYPDLFVYRGMMLANVPNLAFVMGYTNSSWTLKADLTSEYVCRLLNDMRRHGASVATPRLNDGDADEEPMIDFTSGYVLRSIDQFPRQGTRIPWRVYQNYILDYLNLRFRSLRDKVLDIR
ncbi:MAG: NAD(P)/FAD-dependent oxidoreductase [Pseudomonadota bacterium]